MARTRHQRLKRGKSKKARRGTRRIKRFRGGDNNCDFSIQKDGKDVVFSNNLESTWEQLNGSILKAGSITLFNIITDQNTECNNPFIQFNKVKKPLLSNLINSCYDLGMIKFKNFYKIEEDKKFDSFKLTPKTIEFKKDEIITKLDSEKKYDYVALFKESVIQRFSRMLNISSKLYNSSVFTGENKKGCDNVNEYQYLQTKLIELKIEKHKKENILQLANSSIPFPGAQDYDNRLSTAKKNIFVAESENKKINDEINNIQRKIDSLPSDVVII